MVAIRVAFGRSLAALSRLVVERGGTAAIEAAIVVPTLVILLFNTVDFSRLIWARMEVENAAQIGAQAAYTLCAPYMPSDYAPPVTTNCSNLSSKVTTAIQSTSLGAAVTLSPSTQLSAGTAETYYCTVSGSLVSAGASPPSAMPADCSGATGGSASDAPGDYITITVGYSYTPIFSGLSLAAAQTLTASGMQRLE